MQGLYANIWGIDLMVSKNIPIGTVYGIADPEFVGVVPIRTSSIRSQSSKQIRQDIKVNITEVEQNNSKFDLNVIESIGTAILNPKGVAVACKR
jgi:hypothetical protein